MKLPTILFLIAGSILALVHTLALELSLYWQHPWLDIPVHILGGATIALGIFTIHDLVPRFPVRLLLPIPILMFVLLGGLLWEVFEIQIGIPFDETYPADTMTDLIMDILGGVIGYVVAYAVSSVDLEEAA